MNIGHIYEVRWRYVKNVAFAWLDRIDKFEKAPPSQTVAACAILFLLLCERFKLKPSRVLDAADKIIKHSRAADPQYVRAIAEYLNNELKDE